MFAFSVAFTSWTLRTVEADVRESVLSVQRSLVRSTANDIEEKIELRRDAMVTIARLLGPAAPAPGAEMDAFFAPRPVLQKMFDAVLVVDASGRVIYDLPHGTAASSTGPSVASTDFFRRAMTGASLVISTLQRAHEGGEPYVVFASPLHSREGQVEGLLIGALNLTRPNFLGNLGRLRIGQEGYFTAIELGDPPVYVLHGEQERIMKEAPLGLQHPIMVQARQGLEGAVVNTGASGVEMLRSFVPLRAVPWVLVAVYPTSEAYAGLRERRREVLGVGVLLFTVASLAAWLMSAHLLRPLTRLREVMDRHASEPGLPMAPQSFGSTELAALVQAYNAQASRRREFEERLAASERHMQAITDNIPARIAYIDAQERYTFANARSRSAFVGTPDDCVGRTMREVRTPEAYAQIAGHIASALRGEAASFEQTSIEDGRLYHYQSSYLPDLDADGKVHGFYLMSFDITALKEAQARQARVEGQLRAIADNLPVLIAYLDDSQRYVFLNATFWKWLGIDPEASVGRPLSEVVGAEVYAHRRDKIERCLAGERVAFATIARTLAGDRQFQIEYIPDIRPDGTVAGCYTLSTDVTDLKAAQDALSLLVRADTLTGLPNRYRFNEILPLALERCASTESSLALMFIDIDHFKQINDTFGHAAGDHVLKEFGQRLRDTVRTTDTVARLAGDEFVAILEGLHGEAEPQLVAHKIIIEVSRPFDIDGRLLTVSASIGIAFHHGGGATTKALLAQADAALYQAKAAGRNVYRQYG